MSPETGPSSYHYSVAAGDLWGVVLSPSRLKQFADTGILRESHMLRNPRFHLAGALLLVCAPVHAGNAAVATNGVDETLVTAARTPLNISRIASSTTVITAEQIEQRQARFVTDIIRSVPGFAVTQSGVTGTQTEVRVRGAEANHVLVLIDGVRANDPATGDGFRWELLTTANIERIEIVRGAQSALWGTDAVAGVVNIITKSGGSGSRGGGYAEAGSNKTVNGGLNAGIGGVNWSIDAGVERLDTDGENIARSGVETDGSETTAANFAARVNDSEGLSLDFRLRATGQKTQTDDSDFLTGLPADSDSVTDSDVLTARLRARLARPDSAATHSLSLAWFESDNTFLVNGLEDTAAAAERLTVTWQSDLQLGDDVLSLAAENETSKFRQSGPVIFGDPNQRQEIDTTSFIADYQGLSFGNFSWMLSVRYDDNSDFDDVLNGRLGGTWNVTPATKLRASVGTAQKNPTFTERFGYFPGTFLGNPDLKPEQSTSYEIGIDQRWLDDDLEVGITLFKQDLEDEIDGFVFNPGSGLFTARNLAGRSKRSGAEFAASLNVSTGLDIGATYTYTDSKEERVPGTETREVRRPRHTGGLWATWRSPAGRVSATLNADYSGTRTDVIFPPPNFLQETVRLGSYWLVDLTANFRVADEATLYIRGTNLLDEDYEEVLGFNTLNRAIYAGFRLNFGN